MISSLALSFRRGGRATAFALALAVGATSLTPLVPPLGQSARAAVISIHVRERLSRYGEWQQSTRYGEVWVPSVETGWRPYTVGRWVWTDDGWYWDSSEPFGQIVFHYGRWAYDPDLGWVWIVGDEWAPAWVVWRESDDDIGWMPAPPRDDVPVQDAWWAFVPIAAIGVLFLVLRDHFFGLRRTGQRRKTSILRKHKNVLMSLGEKLVQVAPFRVEPSYDSPKIAL